MFHVYKHTGDPESPLIDDPALRSEEGFTTLEEASEATKRLFPEMHLVMLRGRHSSVMVAIRRPGAEEWSGPR